MERRTDRRTTGRMAVDRETHFFRLVEATHTEHFFSQLLIAMAEIQVCVTTTKLNVTQSF